MIKTNEEKLVKMAARGEIVHPSASSGYSTDWEGKPRIGLGISGIKYNITLGDPLYGWMEEEHIEPGLSFNNKNPRERTALSVLACIGNEVEMTTGEAKGAKGYVIGKHVNFIAWFKDGDRERIHIGDQLQVKTWGVGLKIEGYDDVKVNKISPPLLHKMNIKEEGGKLVVPVVNEFPAYIMGSGYGMFPVSIDYDIQTTSPDAPMELGVDKLRFGDIIAIRDQLNWWGRGYYKGAITIGIVIHGWSSQTGHGPGVTTILSSKNDRINIKIDPHANIANYLGIRKI